MSEASSILHHTWTIHAIIRSGTLPSIVSDSNLQLVKINADHVLINHYSETDWIAAILLSPIICLSRGRSESLWQWLSHCGYEICEPPWGPSPSQLLQTLTSTTSNNSNLVLTFQCPVPGIDKICLAVPPSSVQQLNETNLSQALTKIVALEHGLDLSRLKLIKVSSSQAVMGCDGRVKFLSAEHWKGTLKEIAIMVRDRADDSD